MTARNEFWIPDSEVHEKKASPTSRGKKYEETREHSGKIVRSIEGIEHSLECYATDNDNIDVLMVIETRKHGDIREPLEKNGMDQQYRFSDTECLASMSMDSFHKMADNARRYDSSFDEPKRRYVSRFNHVVDLSPNTDAKRKMSRRLRKNCDENRGIIRSYVTMLDRHSKYRLDPYLDRIDSVLDGARVTERIPMKDGTVLLEIESYPALLTEICSNPVVLSATSACIVTMEDDIHIVEEDADLRLDPSVDPKCLGTVAILDTRIDFPESFGSLIDGSYVCDGADTAPNPHGSWVASKAAFGNMDGSVILRPRNRVFGCAVYNEGCTTAHLIPRLEEAVKLLKDRIKVFNLSINCDVPLDRDDPLTKKADELQYEHGVQIIISMGNHGVWKSSDSLSFVFEDDDTRMTAPADSILGISVGSVSGETYPGLLSKRNEPSPYTRKGMLVNGIQKPDMVARSGNVGQDLRIKMDPYSRLVTRRGFAYNAGTSFAAPYVAGLLEMIRTRIGDDGILTSKAVLYDSLKPIEWVPESDYVRREDLLGYGLAEESDIAEDGSRVTLMRLDSIKTGTEKIITVEVPEIEMPNKKVNRLVVTVTCVTMSRVEHRYGEDSVRTNVVPYCKNAEGASPANNNVWSPIHKRVFKMKKMKDKDWKIRLECKSRDEVEEDVEYALVVSIWDPKGNDICARIRNTNRYPEMVSVREMVRLTERMRAENKIKLNG